MKFSTPVLFLTAALTGLSSAGPIGAAEKTSTVSNFYTEPVDLEMIKLYENGTLPTIHEEAKPATSDLLESPANPESLFKRQDMTQCWSWVCHGEHWENSEGQKRAFWTLYGNRWGYGPMRLNQWESRGTRCNGWDFVVSYRGAGNREEHHDGRNGVINGRGLPGPRSNRCVTSRDIPSYWMMYSFAKEGSIRWDDRTQWRNC